MEKLTRDFVNDLANSLRERFSIKFNENDPSHETVIGILEQQGPRQKAQFIANAVLHYIHCPKTPDITIPQTVDRAAIEEIVAEILGRKETGKKTEHRSDIRKKYAPESETVKPGKEQRWGTAIKRDERGNAGTDCRYHVSISEQLKSTGRESLSAL